MVLNNPNHSHLIIKKTIKKLVRANSCISDNFLHYS